MIKAKKILTGFTDILNKPEMQILPGQIAFCFLMSIVPIATISAIVASYITHSFDFMGVVETMMPSALSKILLSLADDIQFQGVAFVLVLYLLLGSNAPASIITASNLLYDVEQPNYLKLKMKSFYMTVIIVILLLFVVLIPLFGDTIVKFLIELFDIDFLYHYRFAYVILKGLGSFLIMYFIIKTLYTIAPSKKIKSSTTTKGALFTSIGWIVATYIFAFYITNIASYDVLYGNFANILIILLWLYILAYLFVVGMALNVDNFHKQGKCMYDKKREKRNKENKNAKNENNQKKERKQEKKELERVSKE